MSYTANTEWIEDAKDDFDDFVSQRNWKSAQAIIDQLYEQGFEHEAVILRKAYLKAQADALDEDELLELQDKNHIPDMQDYVDEQGR